MANIKDIVDIPPWENYWEAFADEEDHYSYVRCHRMNEVYEVVRVTHDRKSWESEFVHDIIFMTEYSEQELAEIVRGFDYNSLDDFRADTSDPRTPDVLNYKYLVSLMAECREGRKMERGRANLMANAICMIG